MFRNKNKELIAGYAQEVKDIETARKEAKSDKLINQDKLFKKLLS